MLWDGERTNMFECCLVSRVVKFRLFFGDIVVLDTGFKIYMP